MIAASVGSSRYRSAAFDAHTTGSAAFANGASASNTGLTIGPNATALLAIWIGQTAPTGLSVTWNGVAMVQIGYIVGTGDGGVIALFGMVSPATGNHALAATWTTSTYGYLAGISFTNTPTSSVVNAFKNFNAKVTTSSTTDSITLSGALGNLSVCAGVNNGSGTVVNSIAATGSTQDLLDNTNQSYATGHAPSAASTTWTMTLSVAGISALVGVDVVGAGVGGGTTRAPYFSVSHGKIFTPSGSLWRGAGVAIAANAFGSAIDVWAAGQSGGVALANKVLSLFPNINFVRIACWSYNTVTASGISNFVDTLTSAGVVVVIENHDVTFTVYTGSTLTTESDWYANMALYYKSNPHVWFASMNEPGTADSAQHVATYNAIRSGTTNVPNVNSNTIVIFEAGASAEGQGQVSGSYWYGQAGTEPDLTLSNYATMYNVGWDLHSYNHFTSYSTDPTTIINDFNQRILNFTSIATADVGYGPVLSVECGNATGSSNVDAGGPQQVQTTYQNPNIQGVAAWLFGNAPSGTDYDDLTNGGGVTLNTYGTAVAGYIQSYGSGPG